ncbi:MAG: toll/interleukin-1 receptor domain-containing protein [Chthoniobacteraceae bacterium]
MRRNKELLKLILVNAEGDAPRPELSGFSEPEIVHHAAYLIKHGYLEGSVVENGQGEADGVAYTGLTESGYDYLEQQRVAESPAKIDAVEMNLDFFVSHSSKDEKLAGAVARLLQLAFNLSNDRIRCTSVPGFKLPCGADTDEQLRQEVYGCKVLVGILTLASTSAPYVLFELGARWGAGKPLAPLLAGGADATSLPGPLKGKNALAATRKEDLVQFLENMGAVIGITPISLSSLFDVVDQITGLASSASPVAAPSVATVPILPAEYHLLVHKWINENHDQIYESGVVDFAEIEKGCGIPIQEVARCFRRAIQDSDFEVAELTGRFARVCIPEAFG